MAAVGRGWTRVKRCRHGRRCKPLQSVANKGRRHVWPQLAAVGYMSMLPSRTPLQTAANRCKGRCHVWPQLAAVRHVSTLQTAAKVWPTKVSPCWPQLAAVGHVSTLQTAADAAKYGQVWPRLDTCRRCKPLQTAAKSCRQKVRPSLAAIGYGRQTYEANEGLVGLEVIGA
jgi:hypothetical protein